ncbi:hypothetical protein KGM_207729 [Danaus plexippus plexippus]|uniref:Uncharacterized protein n=1 Tax=Danaus plexippus plexippus TaxID=278856 RepID=A0A212ENE0_DANPL|nr:hypothetical protein KGM_207729 [Danaus plexippus plexippus]
MLSGARRLSAETFTTNSYQNDTFEYNSKDLSTSLAEFRISPRAGSRKSIVNSESGEEGLTVHLGTLVS